MDTILNIFEERLRVIIREELEQALNAQKSAEAKEEKNTEPFMTRNELAEYLHISLPTIWTKMKNRQLPYHKIGRRVLFRKSEVDAVVKIKKFK